MTFTIEQIKNYLLKQDSLGDVLYNLSEENILKANEVEETDEDVTQEELDEFEMLLNNSLDEYIDNPNSKDNALTFYSNKG